jgi:hypothetical protein
MVKMGTGTHHHPKHNNNTQTTRDESIEGDDVVSLPSPFSTRCLSCDIILMNYSLSLHHPPAGRHDFVIISFLVYQDFEPSTVVSKERKSCFPSKDATMATLEQSPATAVSEAQLPMRKRKKTDEETATSDPNTPEPLAKAAKVAKRPGMSKAREIRLEQNRCVCAVL